MSTANVVPVTPKRVFLSYAWESDEFRLWVKRLATRLRDDGVEARLDDWHLPANGNIPEFMNREVREADWVLVLCSPGYQERVRATEDGQRVSGVGWETRLLTSAILVSNQNKTLAVLVKGEWAKAAPDSLLGQVYFDLSRPATFEQQYRALLQAITGSRDKAPPVGPPPTSSPEEQLEPLRYRQLADDGDPSSTRGRWLRRQAPAVLGLALAIDVLLVWFVSAALPFASISLAWLYVSLLPVALALVVAVSWLARILVARRRPVGA
jgi:hypothetical protein